MYDPPPHSQAYVTTFKNDVDYFQVLLRFCAITVVTRRLSNELHFVGQMKQQHKGQSGHKKFTCTDAKFCPSKQEDRNHSSYQYRYESVALCSITLQEAANQATPTHLFAEDRTSVAAVVFQGMTSDGAVYMPASKKFKH